MEVLLTPELERLVQQKLESGRYQSPDEVLRQALLLLDARDTLRNQKREALFQAIQIGIDQADRGEVVSGSARSALDALRLLDDRDVDRNRRFEEVRRAIQVGIEEADRGELEEVDVDAMLEDIRRRERNERAD